MNTVEEPAATEAAWLATQGRNLHRLKVAAVLATVSVPGVALLAMLVSEQFVTGDRRYLLAGAIQIALAIPIVYGLFRFVRSDQDRANRVVGALTADLTQAVDVAQSQAHRRELQADRQEFETRLANALDMAEGEPEVIDVIERSFSTILPTAPVELLLADNSHAHLSRMASSATGAPGCGVDSPDHCPAARRAQVQRFDDSDDLDACPKLRGRPGGSVSAVCVPVSIMGRTVGVIHSTGPAGARVSEDSVLDLGTLSKLGGARIGLLRVMAETQLQAATDSLTGLLNRRSFESQVTRARRETPSLSVAMADLDHFKTLNDTYGHETGDRALRLFAQVLAGSVRSQDLVCRQGGEEFVVAMIGCEAATARGVLDAVRARLEAAITVAGLPAFTVSFGLVQSRDQEGLPALVERADVALFEAKRSGRDRVVVHDAAGAVVAVPETGPEADRRTSDVAGRAVTGSGRITG